MGQIFGNLVHSNSALQQDGQTRVVGADQALDAANKALPSVIAANTPMPTYNNGVLSFDSARPVSAPLITTPTFQQVTQEQNGNPGSFVSPGLTTKGKLLAGLLVGARGIADGIANGSLDAPRNGESNFGRGFQGALFAPQVRQQQAIAQEREQLQNQILSSEAQDAGPALLFRQKKRVADLAQTVAQTDASRAEADLRRAGTGLKEKSLADKQQEALDAGLVKDTPAYNKYVFGDALRQPATPQPSQAGLALQASGGDPAKALDLLNKNAIQRAIASRPPKEQPNGISPSEQRLINADADVLAKKARLRGLLKEQSNPLSLADNIDQQIESATADLGESVSSVLDKSRVRSGSSSPVTGKPLTAVEAQSYLTRAGGDKNRARQLARQDGRSF